MKKQYIFGLFAFLLMVGGLRLNAQGPSKTRAAEVMQRTYEVIITAQEGISSAKVYTGNFAKAVNHADYALELFHDGDYAQAMRHSLRARMLAAAALKPTGQAVPTTKMQEDFTDIGGMQSPDELDKALLKNATNQAADDQEVLDRDFSEILLD